MFPCLQSIVDAQAQEYAEAFKTYARLVQIAARDGGQLDNKSIDKLRGALTAIGEKSVHSAQAHITALIELDRFVQVAAGISEAQAAHQEAVKQDQSITTESNIQRERIEGERKSLQSMNTFNLHDLDRIEAKLTDISTQERIAREELEPTLRARSVAYQQTLAASKAVEVLRSQLTAILAVPVK